MPRSCGSLAHSLFDLGLRDFSEPHAEGHVGVHVEMRKERVVLKNHRDIAVVRQFVGDVLAVEQDLTFSRDLEPGDDAHCRGLAAARGAHEDNELTVICGERKILDRDDLAEALPHLTELDPCHSTLSVRRKRQTKRDSP